MGRGKTGVEGSAEDIKLQITPMIDVTFLLLIFFMLLPFRSLERKLAAFLPKDRGLAKTKIKLEEVPKITVELKRSEKERITTRRSDPAPPASTSWTSASSRSLDRTRSFRGRSTPGRGSPTRTS